MSARTEKAVNIDSINPLISKNCDTFAVSAALNFIAKSFAQVNTDDGMDLDYEESFGLSILLRACSSALDEMNSPRCK